METIQIIQALNDAIKIIIPLRNSAACGSTIIWRMLRHAEDHLDKQIEELLQEEAQ